MADAPDLKSGSYRSVGSSPTRGTTGKGAVCKTIQPSELCGFQCPEQNPVHQPLPDPWWAGSSLYKDCFIQPQPPSVSRFFHTFLFPEQDTIGQAFLQVGDMLTSPAYRRTITGIAKAAGGIQKDGCLALTNFDVHAVYVSTYPLCIDNEHTWTVEVEPQSQLWVDPEQPGMLKSWCTTHARIVRFVSTDEAYYLNTHEH